MTTMQTMQRAVHSAFAAVAASSVLVIGSADAAVYGTGSRTSQFDTTMTIIADCTIAANNLSFGTSQGVLATSVTANTTLGVTCTSTTPYNIGMSAGTATGSTIANRVMTGTVGNSSNVAYNLQQTSGGGNWGNTQGTDTMSGTGTGAAQTLTVYGVIPSQTTPQPDTYKSTITATVFF